MPADFFQDQPASFAQKCNITVCDGIRHFSTFNTHCVKIGQKFFTTILKKFGFFSVKALIFV
jgi:hypothetical protein